jgi:hypothetical protein
MSGQDFVLLKIASTGDLTLQFGPLFLLLVLIGLLGFLFWRRKAMNDTQDWSIVESEISLGNIGKVKIKPSYEDIQIAHKAWVELATRKAGLPFDEEHDVIVDVYNSWYELFREMRSLTKQIPAEKIRKSKDTQELVRLLIDALNLGLRPHLTRWQAKFRRWYSHELETDKKKTPQQIQRRYREYRALVDDLRDVNEKLVAYTMFIKDIAHGQKNNADKL